MDEILSMAHAEQIGLTKEKAKVMLADVNKLVD